jgi:ATP-dependent DNA helicase RecG
MLRRLKVVVVVSYHDRDVVSLAGLLALGKLPQDLFPQLMLTFVHYSTSEGVESSTGIRYLDSVIVEGPIPRMVQETMAALRRNMRRRAVVEGSGRDENWEYPEIALREAIVNALVHRDYSPDARGTQVQLEMYPDRLVIRNPGGLFGPISLDDLGEEGTSSARNATLMRLLRDVPLPEDGRPVCENVGSGIRAMIQSLRAAHMRPPEFQDKIATFRVTFPNHSLLSAEVVGWINTLGSRELTESQCVALAMLREGEAIDNRSYRQLTGVDSRVATLELRDLVARELVEQEGAKRWARYRLHESVTPAAFSAPRQRADRRRQILDALGDAELSRTELTALTGIRDAAMRRWLGILQQETLIERVGTPRSRHVRYRRSGRLFDEVD